MKQLKSFSVWTTPPMPLRNKECVDAIRNVYPDHVVFNGTGCPYPLSNVDYRYDSDVIRLWYMATMYPGMPLLYVDFDVTPIGTEPYSFLHDLPAYLECRGRWADIAIMYRPVGCEEHYQGMLDWYVEKKVHTMKNDGWKASEHIGWPQSLLNIQGHDGHRIEYIKDGWFKHHEFSLNPITQNEAV